MQDTTAFRLDDDIERLEVFVIDVNGIPRGKWISPRRAPDVLQGGVAMPMSVFALDVWGRDVSDSALASGDDSDGLCTAVPRTVRRAMWAKQPTAQALLTMGGFFADPRAVLARAAERLARHGLTPVVALELEFYLSERGQAGPRPPHAAHRHWACEAVDILSLASLGRAEAVLHGIAAAAAEQDIPVDTILSENGPGQFEINLMHGPDVLKAADDAVLLKRIVKGVADRHGLCATFMAKPYGTASGSGMHVHVSLLGSQGRNVFAGPQGPSAPLRHAVAGLLQELPGSLAVFAPHANSHRRLRGGAHAPSTVSWGIDNRRAAIRVIDAGEATRIEHRVSGADANPYLVLAAIMGGIAAGLEAGLDPAFGPGVADRDSLAVGWEASLDRFARSSFAEACFGARYRDLYSACKAQERVEMLRRVPDFEYEACLDTV